MKIIGLTGPTGSGKTLLSEVAKNHGIVTINADLVAHKTLESEEARKRLIEVFGNGILTDSKIDRKKLGAAAFLTEESTERLNQTVLPLIVNDIKKIIEKTEGEFVLLDAPTLFESGIHTECDYIISVISDESIRKKRIIERDSLSDAEAELRLARAKSDEFFISCSSHIIFNNKSAEDFKTEAESVILSIINNN